MGTTPKSNWIKPLKLKVYPDCTEFPQSDAVDSMQFQMETFLARGWSSLFPKLQNMVNLYAVPKNLLRRPDRAYAVPVQEINPVMNIALSACTYTPVFEGIDDFTLIPQSYNMLMQTICESLYDFSLQEIGKRTSPSSPYPSDGPDFDMSIYVGTRLLFRKSFRAAMAYAAPSDQVKMYFNFDGLSAGLLKYIPNRIENDVVINIPHLVFQLSWEGFFRAVIGHAEEKLSRPGWAQEGTLHTWYVSKVCLERIRTSLLHRNEEGWRPWDGLYFGRQCYFLKPLDKRMGLEFVYQGLSDEDPWGSTENELNFMMQDRGPNTRPILNGYPLNDDHEGEDNVV